jgi:phosphoribosyl-ATP pyrophosphohydrolase
MAKSGKKTPVTRTTSKTSEKAVRRQKTERAPAGADPAAHVQPAAESTSGGAEVPDRLWAIIDSRKEADPALSHSARLLAKGTPQVVQKLGEEFVECLIEAISGNREGLKRESADVLYHLLVTWANAGLRPDEVWTELARREEISQLTEDAGVPLKRLLAKAQMHTTKIP